MRRRLQVKETHCHTHALNPWAHVSSAHNGIIMASQWCWVFVVIQYKKHINFVRKGKWDWKKEGKKETYIHALSLKLKEGEIKILKEKGKYTSLRKEVWQSSLQWASFIFKRRWRYTPCGIWGSSILK